MASKYYAPGRERAARVGDLFAAVAPRYDLINDLQSFGLHRWWKRRVVRLAGVRPGEPVLDVCCGTGDIAFRLARAGARTTGLDFSPAMLAVADRRAEALPATDRPDFREGDAMALPFPDNQFAAVTMGYGLRNLSDWRVGLAELLRVVRPGGRVVILEFGKPDNAAWRGIYFRYLRLAVPLFGRWFCGDADTHGYILESLMRYPAQHGVAGAMREMRCTDVRIVSLLGGVMSINVGTKPAA